MPDKLRSPIKHHLALHRIDPRQGVWYIHFLEWSLMAFWIRRASANQLLDVLLHKYPD
jgi:hypothetical protein